VLLALAAAGCGGSGSGTEQVATPPACARTTQPAPAARTAKAPAGTLDESKTYEVVLRTNCGSFTIRLEPETSPHAASSFVSLAEVGYFDHTAFHRIVPGVMIEAGDPTASGNGGPGYTTHDDPRDAEYTHGVVAMVRPDGAPAGTAGSQFLVVTGPTADLPPGQPVVGRVVEGLEVVDHIGTLGGDTELPTEVQNTSGLPTEVVVIERATVVAE
jgi:peptidyl-prolyl cis-trans isomerase B (cyclophilin B)